MLGKVIAALCLLHVIALAALLLGRTPVPDRPDSTQTAAADEYSFTVTSHDGIELFGREVQIAYSGILTKVLAVLSLPALALALLVESQLIGHTNLTENAVSNIVGTAALAGVVLQWLLVWLVFSWLRHRVRGDGGRLLSRGSRG